MLQAKTIILYQYDYKRHVKALVNANSVTERIFIKEDHAQNHCLIGNICLALDEIVRWIDDKPNKSN